MEGCRQLLLVKVPQTCTNVLLYFFLRLGIVSFHGRGSYLVQCTRHVHGLQNLLVDTSPLYIQYCTVFLGTKLRVFLLVLDCGLRYVADLADPSLRIHLPQIWIDGRTSPELSIRHPKYHDLLHDHLQVFDPCGTASRRKLVPICLFG
jgi:hypothetical protein